VVGLIFAILAVVAVGIWAGITVRNRQAPPPPPETVEAWVAARDLPAGTVLHKDELPTLVVKKQFPKGRLPASAVIYEEDLYEMRLSRPVRQGEPFDLATLSKSLGIRIPKDMDLASLSFTVRTSSIGMIVPGKQVQILALGRRDGQLVAFPLFENMLVITVDSPANSQSPGMTDLTVSFAMDDDMYKLLELAQARGCRFALIRQPGDPLVEKKDLFPRMTTGELERLTNFVEHLQPAGEYSEKSDHVTYIAPAPRPKPVQP